MRPLVLPVAAVMLANAPAAFAQEDPATAGIYPSGMNANAPASFAQENPATAGVYPPDQSGMIEPRKALPPSANENKAGIIPPSNPLSAGPARRWCNSPARTRSPSQVTQTSASRAPPSPDSRSPPASIRSRSPGSLVWAPLWSTAARRSYKWAPTGSSATPTD